MTTLAKKRAARPAFERMEPTVHADASVDMTWQDAQVCQADGVRAVKGHRLSGLHSAPWEEGNMIWQSVQDACALLQER